MAVIKEALDKRKIKQMEINKIINSFTQNFKYLGAKKKSYFQYRSKTILIQQNKK